MGVVYSQALSQSGVHQPISGHSGHGTLTNHGTLTQSGQDAARCQSGRATAGSTLSRGRGGTLVSGDGGGGSGGPGGGVAGVVGGAGGGGGVDANRSWFYKDYETFR